MILFSVFGSCVKWLNAGKKAPSTYRVLMVDAITAAFCGGLVFGAYLWQGLDKGLAFVIAGLTGYFGTRAIDLAGKFIVKKLELDDFTANSEKEDTADDIENMSTIQLKVIQKKIEDKQAARAEGHRLGERKTQVPKVEFLTDTEGAVSEEPAMPRPKTKRAKAAKPKRTEPLPQEE